MKTNDDKTYRHITKIYDPEDGVLLLDKTYFPDSNRIRPHHIEQLIPFLQELPNLTCLGFLYQNLGNKAVQALAPLTDLSSLKLLLLPGNLITDQAASTLATFHHLTSLNLANNSIGSNGVQNLSFLTNLKLLILDGSMVEDHEATYIAQLKNLEILHLNHCALGNKGFHALKDLSSLRDLELGSSNISEKGLFPLAGMPKLANLNLDRLKITNKGAKLISSMKNLTDLSLNHNLIGDEGAFDLSTLPKLNKLYLTHNQLGNKGLITLAQLPNLAELDLSHNAPNKNIIQRFSQALSPRSHQKTVPLSLSSFLKPGNEKKLRLRIAEHASHLETLDLSNLGLTDYELIELSPSIKSLENLTSLNLSNNHINGHAAPLLGQLTNLVHLNLSQNHIYNTSFLQKLTRLESLDLSNCLIGSDNKNDFCNLPRLKKLKLTGYDLNSSFVHIIGQLTKLEFLDLTGSSIGNEGAKSLSHLTKLKRLYVNDNFIGDAGINHLSKLTDLEKLEIYSSPNSHGFEKKQYITPNGVASLSRLKQLTNLKLSSHHLEDKGLQFLATLPHLQHLELYSMSPYADKRFTIGWEALGNSKSLRTLELREHNIDDEGAIALSQNTELTDLDLYNNNIGEKGAKALLNLKKLEFLDLTKSEISAEIAARLSSQTKLEPIESARKRIRLYDPSKGKLDLSGLNLGNFFLGALIVELSQLENLTFLDLDFNYIGNGGLRYLPALTTLTRLSIQAPEFDRWRPDNGERINNADILATLPNLIYLNLTGNYMEDITFLQQNLPQSCKLLYTWDLNKFK